MESPAEPLVFGALTVDFRAFTATRDGARLDLEPKAFDLLALLVERRGELVTKQDILDRVWKDTAVTDNALTRIVAQLRKAIGDDAREARYIETVPTRGYRWIAEPAVAAVTALATADAIGSPALSTRSGRYLWPSLIVATAVAGAVAIGLSERRDPVASPAVSVLTTSQVTVSRGLDAFPAFAPDGRTIAFASDRTGAFELYARSLGVSAAEHAITGDGQQNVQPSWSPDGGQIAYHSMARGGIWMVPASGGAPRQIASFGSHPQWSPDGRRIAFQSDALTDITPTAFGAMAPSTIWIIDVAGSGDAPRALTRSANPAGGHAAPAWSPDGTRIVFAAYGTGSTAVWSVPAMGGTPSQLLAGERHIFEPQLSHDGRWLYAATGTAFVLRLPLAPDTGLPAGEPQWLATPGVTASRYLRLSRDGERLAISGLNLRSTLLTLALDPLTGTPAGEPSPIADDTSRRKTSPAFSPDGRRIAFTASRVGTGPDVWVFDTETRSETPITSGDRPGAPTSVAYFRPNWFPDGLRVGFLEAAGGVLSYSAVRVTERLETTLLALPQADADAEGGMTDLGGTIDFSLSPDGRSLAYSAIVRATGLPRLFVRPLAGGPARALADGQASENFPAWSPDGRLIAFELTKDGATHLAVHPVTGGVTKQVTSGAGQHWVHSWASDNDHVAVARQKDGVWNVWSISVSTGGARPLTSYTQPSAHVRYPAWSPRGDRVVYECGEVRGNVWVAVLR